MSVIAARRIYDGAWAISLADPERRNAMSWEMAEEFHSTLSRLIVSETPRCLFITGEGSAFSAGGRLDELRENCEKERVDIFTRMLRYYRSFLAVLDAPCFTVAAINGPAIGAGLALSLACDMRIGSPRAKLGATFIRLGLTPGMGSTVLLPQLVGQSLATQMFSTGRIMSAQDAFRVGLITDLYEDLDAGLDSIGRQFAQYSGRAIEDLIVASRRSKMAALAEAVNEAWIQSACFVSPHTKNLLDAALNQL